VPPYSVGPNVGVEVFPVGVDDGTRVLIVGDLVGLFVGLGNVGAFVGLDDGACVGLQVSGILVGPMLGDSVGLCGESVGDTVVGP
jgi:hypothetical protein